MDESDEDLLKGWLYGDARAFEKFYLRHRGRVMGYARKKGIQNEDLAELTQDVFLKLHTHISLYEPEKRALPWFFTIVHNSCVDFLKKGGEAKHNLQYVSIADLFAEPQTQETVRSDAQALGQAIQSLNERQKQILDLRVNEELSFEEIAAVTGKSAVSMRKAYSRTVQTLRNWFGENNRR